MKPLKVKYFLFILLVNSAIFFSVAKGFQFQKHGKKHDEYYNPDTGVKIQIERHKSQEVRPGLMKELKRIIGF